MSKGNWNNAPLNKDFQTFANICKYVCYNYFEVKNMDKNKRQSKQRVSVPLSADMVERLDNFANQYGVSRSTMGAILIGDSIIQKEKTEELLNLGTEQMVTMIKNMEED